jgi:carboxypeptidase Taq
MAAYETLEARFREINDLEHAAAILSWDEATMMPPESGDARAAALATLAGVMHEKMTAPDTGDLIQQLSTESPSLDQWQTANLREMRRRWQHAVAVPADLVVATSRANSLCEQTWRRCRADNDWKTIAPLLAEVIRLARENAACLGEAGELAPYDALMDYWEPGLRTHDVDIIFKDLKSFLPALIDTVIGKQLKEPPLPLPGPFPIDRQRHLAATLMERLGFDTSRGRLDVSHHPFCGGVRDDTRITTRYAESEFLGALMAVLHETGHALYQQGLPAGWSRQPVGDALGMAIHESQSLLMEMQACRSRDFLRFAAPAMREALQSHDDDPAWSVDNLHKHYILVSKGKIRVDADELTYPLHVILRYEIERALIDGQMGVEDIPDAWNTQMQDNLGLSTDGDYRDGCMQDVHWFSGTFGYFPCYTLGALIAAQLYEAALSAVPGISAAIADGNFGPLLGWLREQVHGRGRLLLADELIVAASGEPLNTRFFKQHAERRYD